MQAAFDSGAHPVIAAGVLLGDLPRCINDADISPTLNKPPEDVIGFTDMTFSSMTHEALLCWRKLNHVLLDFEGKPVEQKREWLRRTEIVNEWEHDLQSKYLQFCDNSQTFQMYTRLVGNGIVATLRLFERRPLHRFSCSNPPPADGSKVLDIACGVLAGDVEKYTDRSLAIWSWFTWVKWYALAVVLAELCGQAGSPEAEKAWPIAEASFKKYGDMVIDESLWKSIEKLMAKARSAREASGMQFIYALLRPHTTVKTHEPSEKQMDDIEMQSKLPPWLGHSYSVSPQQTPVADQQIPGQPYGYVAPPIVPEVHDDVLNAWMNEPDAMSWFNWESFVQDMAETSHFSHMDSILQ